MQPTFQSRKSSRSGTAGMKITKLDLDHLDGGFKYLLCSPRTLGKWSNLTNIFQMGWNHQLATSCHAFSRAVSLTSHVDEHPGF